MDPIICHMYPLHLTYLVSVVGSSEHIGFFSSYYTINMEQFDVTIHAATNMLQFV
jgi:hypothetical protein